MAVIQPTLSNPVVEIDDEPIVIVPNSLAFKKGYGDNTVKIQSAGGGSVVAAVSEDASTKKSMVKFKILSTSENFDLLEYWLERRNIGVTIDISEGEFAEGFEQMVLISEPDRELGADTEIEVTFEGQPAI